MKKPLGVYLIVGTVVLGISVVAFIMAHKENEAFRLEQIKGSMVTTHAELFRESAVYAHSLKEEYEKKLKEEHTGPIYSFSRRIEPRPAMPLKFEEAADAIESYLSFTNVHATDGEYQALMKETPHAKIVTLAEELRKMQEIIYQLNRENLKQSTADFQASKEKVQKILYR